MGEAYAMSATQEMTTITKALLDRITELLESERKEQCGVTPEVTAAVGDFKAFSEGVAALAFFMREKE
jgi:H2-forming N5,N10-methylenetetrahydromethanopterin dehydrogenase-like enzyme